MKMNFIKVLYTAVLLATASTIWASDVQIPEPNEPQEISGKSKQAQKQVLKGSFSSVANAPTSETKSELMDLIAQLEALEVPGLKNTSNKKVKPNEHPAVEPLVDEIIKIVEQDSEPEPTESEEKQVIQESDPNNKEITNLSATPEKIVSPLHSADCLYIGGEYKKAADMYQLALKQIVNPEEDTSRSWILFQAGNCLRRLEPDLAYQFYEKLLTDYPESPWSPAAQSQQQIISWFKANQSSLILEKYLSDPNSL
jgi:tetratricopeptide (TPR) repeat protein